MDKIIKRYNSLVLNYKEIEKSISEQDIHDKRVILRRIFPMLAASKMKPTKVKNGKKAFKLFGQLRNIQVQVLKLESVAQTTEVAKYLAFLKMNELKLSEKVIRFCKKKDLEFPSIKKKSQVPKLKIYAKANDLLVKLEKKIQARSIDKNYDIHKIRIEFKKFRYIVEILLSIDNAEDAKLEKIKKYQDILGEIQDDEILIDGIFRFFKKRKLNINEITVVFERNKQNLIENFDKELDKIIQVCRDIISIDNDVVSLDVEKNKKVEEPDLIVQKAVSKREETGIIEVVDSLKQKPEKLMDIVTAVHNNANIPEVKSEIKVTKLESPTKKNPIKKTEKTATTAKKEATTIIAQKTTKEQVAKKKEAADQTKRKVATTPTEKKVTTTGKPNVRSKAVNVKKEEPNKNKPGVEKKE